MSRRAEFQGMGEFWRSGLRYDFRSSAAAFVILIGSAAFRLDPFKAQWVSELMQQLMNQEGLVTETGELSAGGVLGNNLSACLFSSILGFVPFVCLPAFPLGLNALLLGGMAALAQTGGTSLGLYLLAILPHGIFELPARWLSFAIGLTLCREITALCRKQPHEPFSRTLWRCGQFFSLGVVPLLILAALVEAYVTPALLERFL